MTQLKVERTDPQGNPIPMQKRKRGESMGAMLTRLTRPLYPEVSEQIGLLMAVCKAIIEPAASPTNAPLSAGVKAHPFDFTAAAKLKIANIHHGTCLETAKTAIAGLGHEKDTVAAALDPLCPLGQPWQMLMLKIAEDFAMFGNGYIEVVRDGDRITGLHHLPAADCRIVLEEDRVNSYWSIRGGDLATTRDDRNVATVMARFGDLNGFRLRHMGGLVETPGANVGRKISEVIHLLDPSGLSRWYGVPGWLSAVASMELVQALHQHQFDFHINRGVPEFIVFLTGGRIDKKTWDTMTASLQSHVGVGNSHRSSVFNLTDPNIKAQVEKMAMEGIANGDFFQAMSETLSVNIVSAHRTPPSIAGIMIPGKMGAANETSNALMAYQALKIGPAQTIIEQVLGATLGNSAINGGLPLGPGDFELNTIIDEMAESMQKLAPMDTMSRMKQSGPQAAAEGRDMNAGLKKERAMLVDLLAEALAKIDGQRG